MLVTLLEHTILADGLAPGATVLDLGANRGQFSQAVAERFGARCIAVEADRDLAEAIPAGPLVSVRNLAIAGRDGFGDFHVSEDPESSGLFAPAGGAVIRSERVRQVTLETLLAEEGLQAVDLVKVDIEGAEKPLFDESSDETLLKAAQYTVEFHDFAGLLSPEDVKRAAGRLRDLGFQGIRFTRTNYDWLFFQPDRCGIGRLEVRAIRHVQRNGRYVLRNARRILGGMKAFVINLPRSVDRRAYIEPQLGREGIDHEFVAATDGRDLTAADLERLVDPDLIERAPRWFRPGQVGCCLSHLNAYRRIAAEGLDMALVLEDDAVLPSGINELLRAISEKLDRPEAALMYYTAKAPMQLSEQHAVPLVRKARLLYPLDLGPLNSTMGYVITRSGCLRMIDTVLPIKVGPDSWSYFHEQGALERVRCVHPRPIRAKTDFKSTMDYWGGLTGGLQLTTAIAERRIFPLAQILALRRAMTARKMSRFTVVGEASPYAGP